MISKGFLSEIMKCSRLSLGRAELSCLRIIVDSPISAYGIYLLNKKHIDIKNVRKTFKKIHSKGLIEKTEKKLPHDAKEYRVTSQGLFQILLRTATIYRAIPIDLKRYSDDIILKTILYQFLDVGSLEYFLTLFRGIRLNRYLRNCCEIILEKIETYKTSEFYKQSKSDYIPENVSKTISGLIMDEIKQFIFEITINSKKKISQFILTPQEDNKFAMIHKDVNDGVDDPNYDYAYPNLALAKDKKFTQLLDKIKTEFNDGCHDLLYFYRR